jgi:large subunit ribosomal protein L6
MSILNKEIIKIPTTIQINFENSKIIIKGPLGELALEKHSSINIPSSLETLKILKTSPLYMRDVALEITKNGTINIEKIQDNLIISYKLNEDKKMWGTFKSLIKNNIIGVTEGFKKKLKIEGIGYKATKIDKKIIFNLGYSHEIIYEIPEDIKIEVITPIFLEISGISKQRVGQIAAEIKKLRKTSPYRIKGIYYNDEVIKIKATKKK